MKMPINNLGCRSLPLEYQIKSKTDGPRQRVHYLPQKVNVPLKFKLLFRPINNSNLNWTFWLLYRKKNKLIRLLVDWSVKAEWNNICRKICVCVCREKEPQTQIIRCGNYVRGIPSGAKWRINSVWLGWYEWWSMISVGRWDLSVCSPWKMTCGVEFLIVNTWVAFISW